MNIYAATAILFLSSAQAQQIQSPTAALTTFVPTEGSADELVFTLEALEAEATSMSIPHNTAQIIEAFGYDSKSSKTGGHGYGGYGGYDSKSAKKGSGGYGYGGYDAKSAKGYGSAKGDKGYGAYDSKSAKGEYGSAKSDKGGYGAYDAKSAKGGSGYGDSKSAKGSGYGVTQADGSVDAGSAAASPVEIEETSEPDVPDIVGYLSSLLAELLDVEGQADAVKPASFDIGAIYDIIDHFLNGYGSKSSKSKSGKRF